MLWTVSVVARRPSEEGINFLLSNSWTSAESAWTESGCISWRNKDLFQTWFHCVASIIHTEKQSVKIFLKLRNFSVFRINKYIGFLILSYLKIYTGCTRQQSFCLCLLLGRLVWRSACMGVNELGILGSWICLYLMWHRDGSLIG